MRFTAVLNKGGKIHRITFDASDIGEAYKNTKEFFAGNGVEYDVFYSTSNENGKPYTDGIIEGAWFSCKKVAKYLASHEGLEHQWKLLNDIIARRKGGAAEDCMQEAATALLDSIKRGLCIEKQYDEAFNSVSRWMYQNSYRNWKKGRANNIAIDELGDCAVIVEVSQGLFSCIKQGSNYIPCRNERVNCRTANYIAVILETLHELTEPQLRATYYIVSRDMSMRSAAKAENISTSSLSHRIGNARKTAQTCRLLYNNCVVSKKELEAMLERLSPIARIIAIDVFNSI